MARIELAPEVFDDFDRFLEYWEQFGVQDASERIGELMRAIEVLAENPLIGRSVRGGKRELVIGERSRGYIALYRHLPTIDTVFVLAVRSQRERSFKRKG